MEVSLQSFRKRYTYDSQKDLLGKGGFGEVYKAYDNEDKIFVALKMTQNIANSKYNLIDEIKRFKKLNHPNIINHIEAYEVNTGSSDIHGVPIVYHVGVLEFADQGTLADLLKEKNASPRIVEDIAEDIINGLAYLHTQNIIHRDLKPSNILLFAEGEKIRAKITDFGIAKQADATAVSTQLIGTVEYMAPEFFSTGNITTSADVWSLGVMLIEAFTGLHPFGKTSDGLSNEQIIGNILTKDLSHISDGIQAPYKDIVTRCLLREISIRPANANEIKGLIATPQDAFSEKTQLISHTSIPSNTLGSTPAGGNKWFNFFNKNSNFENSGFGNDLKQFYFNSQYTKWFIIWIVINIFFLLLGKSNHIKLDVFIPFLNDLEDYDIKILFSI
ncbi:MAG: serine/threonine protein kinase [Bacteroidetes bacterium]|nr:serine/threonine protein kinase [Bacteroidota bacterium]